MRSTMVLAAVAVLGTATACTDDDPIEAQMGSASAVITDDPSSASASALANDAQADQTAGPFSGTFTSTAWVSIRAEGGGWLDLGSPADATLSLQSTDDAATIHADAAVPVGTYTHVRLTLSAGEARIAAGAVLGGLTLASDARIEVGGSDGRLVIEKTVEPFTIDTDAHARIRFDLNSEGWVHEQSAKEEAADDDEVRDSTTATRTVDSDE